jgi:hypothetical protein
MKSNRIFHNWYKTNFFVGNAAVPATSKCSSNKNKKQHLL